VLRGTEVVEPPAALSGGGELAGGLARGMPPQNPCGSPCGVAEAEAEAEAGAGPEVPGAPSAERERGGCKGRECPFVAAATAADAREGRRGESRGEAAFEAPEADPLLRRPSE